MDITEKIKKYYEVSESGSMGLKDTINKHNRVISKLDDEIQNLVSVANGSFSDPDEKLIKDTIKLIKKLDNDLIRYTKKITKLNPVNDKKYMEG